MFHHLNNSSPIHQCAALDGRTKLRGANASAFTRLELLAVTAAVALLLAVSVPVWGGNRARSDRVACFNNLRQIGLAMQSWGNDHADRFPQEVPTSEGGTRLHPLAVNVWLHYSWISNELGYAHVLLCPADQGRLARNFSADPASGYLHPNFRNSATSYFLAHASSPFGGRDILAGDRNLSSDGVATCSRFYSANSLGLNPPSANVRWSTNLHGSAGNVVHFDGRVSELSNRSLRQEVAGYEDDNGSVHFITPR